MALIQLNFMSECLMRTVSVQAVIPFDKVAMPGMPAQEKKPFSTLYLLHGIFGNDMDWISGTRIRHWAEEKDLAVIMPAGENHFYVDCKANGERYGEFIGRELPQKMRELFPLSEKREDTFLGGLSMGGYGAVINGLKYQDTFGDVIGLSSALVLEDVCCEDSMDLGKTIFGSGFYPTVFGDLKKLPGSDKDYRALLSEAHGVKKDRTRLYLCCGTEDALLERNRSLAALAKEKGWDCTYEEGPGGHDWIFWDTFIKKAMDWLPLNGQNAGRSSGNIG